MHRILLYSVSYVQVFTLQGMNIRKTLMLVLVNEQLEEYEMETSLKISVKEFLSEAVFFLYKLLLLMTIADGDCRPTARRRVTNFIKIG